MVRLILLLLFLILSLSCEKKENTENQEIALQLEKALKEIDSIKSKNKDNDSLLFGNEMQLKYIRDSLKQSLAKSSANNLTNLYEKLKNAVFIVYASKEEYTSQGTAFLIDSLGTCVSNYHVFDGSDYAYVENSDEDRFDVQKILYANEEDDLIVFTINNGRNYISPLRISLVTPKIGEEVFTIGNPEGLTRTLSKGIVSSFRDDKKIIQITAEITHGSSGGPLFNRSGEVIGVTSSGLSEANLNFAVNIKQLPEKYLSLNERQDFSETYNILSSRAYFYNTPKNSEKRNAFLVKGDKGLILSKENGYAFVIYTNKKSGKITKGWIKQSDMDINREE